MTNTPYNTAKHSSTMKRSARHKHNHTRQPSLEREGNKRTKEDRREFTAVNSHATNNNPIKERGS